MARRLCLLAAKNEIELAVAEKARPVVLAFPELERPRPRVSAATRSTKPAHTPAPLPNAVSDERKGRTLPIALGVLGATGLAGFGIFGALARTQHEQLPRCWPDCSAERIQQINDLYRIEIRALRDRCRAGEFPTSELPSRVVELRKRYVLLSIPVERWTLS